MQDPPLVVRGRGFEPGQRIVLSVGIPGFTGGEQLGTPTADPDGAFTLRTRLVGCGPRVGAGTQFRVSALPDGAEPGEPLAAATYTVTPAPSPATATPRP